MLRPVAVDDQAPSVVVTGASRGLGLATAAHLHRQGWNVVAAMRSVDDGLGRIRAELGWKEGDGRLTGVALDLDDGAAIDRAADAIAVAVGVPDAIVHNAGIAAVGAVEEMPIATWRRMAQTNLIGPVQLTQRLLPGMRTRGSGRIVIVSSQISVRGMPTTSAYSAIKSAVERWAEALAEEIGPFGIGLTLLVPGAFATEILSHTDVSGDLAGVYGPIYRALESSGKRLLGKPRPPQEFALEVARALADRKPFVCRGVGPDAKSARLMKKLMPDALYRSMMNRMLGLPKWGSLGGPDPRRSR